MSIKESIYAGELNLQCVHCKSDWTHQKYVRAWWRNEDAKNGRQVCSDMENTTVTTELTGNPSSRREAAAVDFNCEQCDGITRVQFIQHKGVTVVEIVGVNPQESTQ